MLTQLVPELRLQKFCLFLFVHGVPGLSLPMCYYSSVGLRRSLFFTLQKVLLQKRKKSLRLGIICFVVVVVVFCQRRRNAAVLLASRTKDEMKKECETFMRTPCVDRRLVRASKIITVTGACERGKSKKDIMSVKLPEIVTDRRWWP